MTLTGKKEILEEKSVPVPLSFTTNTAQTALGSTRGSVMC